MKQIGREKRKEAGGEAQKDLLDVCSPRYTDCSKQKGIQSKSAKRYSK